MDIYVLYTLQMEEMLVFINILSISTVITKGCSGLPYIEYFRKLPERGVKLVEECSIEYLKIPQKFLLMVPGLGQQTILLL